MTDTLRECYRGWCLPLLLPRLECIKLQTISDSNFHGIVLHPTQTFYHPEVLHYRPVLSVCPSCIGCAGDRAGPPEIPREKAAQALPQADHSPSASAACNLLWRLSAPPFAWRRLHTPKGIVSTVPAEAARGCPPPEEGWSVAFRRKHPNRHFLHASASALRISPHALFLLTLASFRFRIFILLPSRSFATSSAVFSPV